MAESLVGIARLAAASPSLAVKRQVEYFRLPIESLLNRCANPQLPFVWTINPYRGCEFGCKYCYARYTHEFLGLDEPAQFEEKIYCKERASEVLRRELRQDPGGAIAIGTATDPYQPAERFCGTTLSILKTLAEFRGLRLSITTKSDLVARDIPLLRELAASHAVQVNMSITTLDDALARLLEPRAPRPALRLEAVSELAAAGLSVAIFAMPVLPWLNDSAASLGAVARAGAEAGARSFAANVLFLMPAAQRAFFPFLEQHFPHLAARYRRLYRRGAYLQGPIAERVAALARQLRDKYYPAAPPAGISLPPFGPRQQLTLFDEPGPAAAASQSPPAAGTLASCCGLL